MQQLTESYPFWFAGLSLYGGLLGCSAVSAHRLCRPTMGKFVITCVAFIVTLAALVGGMTLLGFALPHAALFLPGLNDNDPLKTLINFYGMMATWAMGYFSVIAYCMGQLLCTLLQRAEHKRLLPAQPPPADRLLYSVS